MRATIIFTLASLLSCALATECLLLSATPQWMIAATATALVLCLIFLYIAVVRPMKTIANGMDLLRGQDFSSRLSKVGQPDADRLVEMFNTMMEQLKQERLRQHEQNAFLSLLIEASPMGILIYDFDGNLTMMNPAAERIVHGELAEAIKTVKPGERVTIRLGDNSIFRVSRLWFMEMGFRRPFVLIESLTDEVRRAEKDAYGKVIRMIAHEVNNTMAGVKSLLESLADIMAEESDMHELIASCHERCNSMSRFITSYADVVKMPEAHLVPCDINECLRRQIPFLEGLFRPGITLSFNPSAQPAMAHIDTVLLEQAVVNIVKNAIESIAPRQGNVSITVSSNPPVIDIDDNGSGISPEIAGKLFTPFLSTKPDGQGIGLLCISEALRRHNATFSLTTVAPALTRFHIRFPVQ